MIIDSHTHIYNEKTYKDYFKKAKKKISKAVVMAFYKFDLKELLKFVSVKTDLFIIGTIDINSDIKKQIELHRKLFQNNKIFGIKLYPGYQYFYPSDKKIYQIAELCQNFNKQLIFHSGDVWNPDNSALLKYSNPLYIDELAVKFPECKILISHFGFPYHLETANILSKNSNVYTEISGTLDKCNSGKEGKDMLNQYSKDLQRVFFYYPNIKSKVMFGTDYGGEDTPLNLIAPYIEVIKKVFTKKEQDNTFYKTAEKLFFTKNNKRATIIKFLK